MKHETGRISGDNIIRNITALILSKEHKQVEDIYL